MPIQLRWLASTAASSLHAARAVARGAATVNPDTAEAIADPARSLLVELDGMGLTPEPFFEHAVALATRIDAPSQWAKVVLNKLLGPSRPGDYDQQLARRYAALQAAFRGQNPQALAELELRAGPLRQQWEARGPGLWAALARHTDGKLLAETADVVLVQPVEGGGGTAHRFYNSVCIEAVLANPRPELPEVARLAWLLAHLNCDLPMFDGGLSGPRLVEVWRLAMIPPVLAAAEEVELVRNDRPTRSAALAAWTGSGDDTLGDTLAKWWDTYQQSDPPWPVALGALDRMLRME